MTVYVVQEPMERDRQTGLWTSKFNFEAARNFGDVEILLRPRAQPSDITVVADLWKGLADYGPGDFLLLAGNPCLLGAATAIAAQVSGGHVRCLQYNPRQQTYTAVTLDLRPPRR